MNKPIKITKEKRKIANFNHKYMIKNGKIFEKRINNAWSFFKISGTHSTPSTFLYVNFVSLEITGELR